MGFNPTFLYYQKDGALEEVFYQQGLEIDTYFASGYSGFQEGKNNPNMEKVADVGPIPRGDYQISEPFDSPDHGPLAMRLTPKPGTYTFGRSGFLMHGDSLEHPGEASRGCIIMPHDMRERVANVGGVLRVI